MRFAGVVVLYNPENNVLNNIETYLKQLDKLYIVDNSEKNTDVADEIKKMSGDRIEYIGLDKNIGIASAINLAAQRALDNNYNWLLTMDQDSLFQTEILDVYNKYLLNSRRKNVAILSPFYLTERKCDVAHGEYELIYWTMQSANLVNLKVWSKIGGFEESYFIDCVDYEYCLRAKKNGYVIVRCNKAILRHNPAITHEGYILKKKFKYGYASPLRIYYQVRNALYMFKSYHNLHSLQIILIKFGKILLLFDNKKIFFKYFFMAITDYLDNISGKKEI